MKKAVRVSRAVVPASLFCCAVVLTACGGVGTSDSSTATQISGEGLDVAIQRGGGRSSKGHSAPAPAPAPAPTPAPAPAVSVTVTWTPPQLNIDGSALTDVSGYVVMYGAVPTALGQSVNVTGPTNSSAVISGLTSGATYYVAVATVNTTGVSSAPSNPAAVVPQ